MPKRLTPRGEAAPPVEPIITGATLPAKESVKKQTRRPKASDSGIRYIRNLHHIQCRVTLTTGRDIELKARGQREDIDVVSKDEQSDPKFLANKDLIFEVITADEASAIIYKQQTNARAEQHPLWQHLRNEQGKPYEQRTTKIEEVFERQGIVVGQVEETGAGRFTDKNSEVSRVRQPSPQFTQVPGSPGHPATEYMNSVPGTIAPEEYHEYLAFKQWKAAVQEAARVENLSPEEIRDSLNVTVEPVQDADEPAES